MELLSNDKNDKIDPQQLVPKEVRDLPSHPPLDLTPHMDKHMNKAYTCGRDVTVRDFIAQIACQAGLALAVCNGQSDAARRAATDALLFGAVAIVSSLSNLEPEYLHIAIERKTDRDQSTGHTVYIFAFISTLLTYLEAKGDVDTTAFRGQIVSEMEGVKAKNLRAGTRHGWDATQDPTNAVCSNFMTWEFFSSSPKMDPPIQFRTISIPLGGMPWQDLDTMIERIRPVLEQLV